MGGMEILLILGVVVCAGLVLFALARGLYHFSQGHRATTEGAIHDNQVMQNRMMMARIKWQAITIILLVLIGVLAAGRSEGRRVGQECVSTCKSRWWPTH